MVTVRTAVPGDDATLAAFFAAYAEDFAYELGDQDVTGEGRKARPYYEEHGGAVLVADVDGEVVGCVAYEAWGEGEAGGKRARMKRMYVAPSARGLGAGRALAEAVMNVARTAGYAEMVLDTTATMKAATALYLDLGFATFAPDYVAPCRGTVYMRRTL